MDRRIFETYVETQLAPTLENGDIVIMDNLPAHKSKIAEKAIRDRGASVLFLPHAADFFDSLLVAPRVKPAASSRNFSTSRIDWLARGPRRCARVRAGLCRPPAHPQRRRTCVGDRRETTRRAPGTIGIRGDAEASARRSLRAGEDSRAAAKKRGRKRAALKVLEVSASEGYG